MVNGQEYFLLDEFIDVCPSAEATINNQLQSSIESTQLIRTDQEVEEATKRGMQPLFPILVEAVTNGMKAVIPEMVVEAVQKGMQDVFPLMIEGIVKGMASKTPPPLQSSSLPSGSRYTKYLYSDPSSLPSGSRYTKYLYSDPSSLPSGSRNKCIKDFATAY